MISLKRMPWSNVRIFLKLASQRCQLLSVGSKQEASAGHRSGSFESDVLASTSNARHLECLFAKWMRDNSSVNGTWQNFFKGMVKEQIESQPSPSPDGNQKAGGDVLPSIGTTLPTAAAIVAPVLGRSTPVSYSALDTSEGDSSSCVAQSQKQDIGVLSHSSEIRTSGIYDMEKLPTLPKKGCSTNGSKVGSKAHGPVLTGIQVAHNISSNLNRKMSQKKPPEKPEKPNRDKEILTGSRRTGNSRNNFQKKFGSFETFMKFWKHAHAVDKYKRHDGPVMVVKKRSKANAKPTNVMYFKHYYEKGASRRKGKFNKTKTNKEEKTPSKTDKDSTNKKPGAWEAIETPNKSAQNPQSDPETMHASKHNGNTYKTLEELINDIDATALNDNLTATTEQEKTQKVIKTPKLLKNTPKKKPKDFKTALRVFKPEERGIPKPNVKPSSNFKPKAFSKSRKTKLNKPKAEKFIPLRVFNGPKVDEDKSWIYWDELAVKSLRKPSQDTESSTLKPKSGNDLNSSKITQPPKPEK
ncbi:uncharacterized protein LOC6532398 [Drosophila yakuba]|uniref:2-oxoglutarate dehydrogenase E1 component N-terminal domain-containing protein n=1 Tax=Drosophila yakuba TaxID=7245 RepID=B4PDP6_DROYA|nr:uncharacterized protein LOC6532398 [Drosophila yakuba]EDW92861.1 uncharacterized protein Dyak_GE21168 [Drosophila yakuba]